MCTNPLIIVYDKGGTVEVYGECFKLIGLFCLLFLHVSTRKMVPITGRASASFSSMLKLKRIGNE